MNPRPEQIREEIKAAFEASRESPGEPYDEGEFIWFLVSSPLGPDSIHNTFKGKRRLSMFLRRVEAKFSVCFSVNDWETLKSLTQVEERLVYLLRTPRSSLASIRNILMARPPDMLALVILFLSLPVVGISVKLFGVVGCSVLIVPAAAIAKVLQADRRTKRFYRAIEATIRASRALQKGAEVTAESSSCPAARS